MPTPRRSSTSSASAALSTPTRRIERPRSGQYAQADVVRRASLADLPAARPAPRQPPKPREPDRAHAQATVLQLVNRGVAQSSSPPDDDEDDFDFAGTGETVVLELDAIAAGHVGSLPDVRMPSNRRPPQMVRFTPAPMTAVRPEPPRAPSLLPAPPPAPSDAMMLPAIPSRRSLAEIEEDEILAAPLAAVAPPAPVDDAPPPSPPASVPEPSPSVPPPAAPLEEAPKPYDRVAKRPGIFAFAGFGLPPTKIQELPGYALRVQARKTVLREELARARERRSPDVELYEAALESADEDAVKKGMVLFAVAVAVLIATLSGAIVLLA